MDQIAILGIKCSGFHGYYTEEREKGNEFEVDLKAMMNSAISADQTLEELFDYEQATLTVERILRGESKLLIEELAISIGNELWKANESILHSLSVSVKKLNPPTKLNAKFAEVCLSWPRST